MIQNKKEKRKHKLKIMLDTVQREQQNKTNEPKQQGKEKTYRQKIMLNSVKPEQQEKKSFETTRKRENIQVEDNAGHSATRVAEQNK